MSETIMKSFKEYITESKKVFCFKVKIAGDCPDKCETLMKEALAKFDPVKIKAGKRTPIQENPLDFPGHNNVAISVFEVDVNYPATSPMIRSALATQLKMSEECIKVRTPAEQAEMDLNQEHMKTPEGETAHKDALLTKDYETNSEGQNLVGDKHVSNFLKELDKISAERKAKTVKHEGKDEGGMSDPEFEEPKDGRKSPVGQGSKK